MPTKHAREVKLTSQSQMKCPRITQTTRQVEKTQRTLLSKVGWMSHEILSEATHQKFIWMHVEVPHFCKAELRRIIRPTQIVKVLNGSTWTWETIQDNWDYQDCTVQDEFKFIQKTTKLKQHSKANMSNWSLHTRFGILTSIKQRKKDRRNFDFNHTSSKRRRIVEILTSNHLEAKKKFKWIKLKESKRKGTGEDPPSKPQLEFFLTCCFAFQLCSSLRSSRSSTQPCRSEVLLLLRGRTIIAKNLGTKGQKPPQQRG